MVTLAGGGGMLCRHAHSLLYIKLSQTSAVPSPSTQESTAKPVSPSVTQSAAAATGW